MKCYQTYTKLNIVLHTRKFEIFSSAQTWADKNVYRTSVKLNFTYAGFYIPFDCNAPSLIDRVKC